MVAPRRQSVVMQNALSASEFIYTPVPVTSKTDWVLLLGTPVMRMLVLSKSVWFICVCFSHLVLVERRRRRSLALCASLRLVICAASDPCYSSKYDDDDEAMDVDPVPAPTPRYVPYIYTQTNVVLTDLGRSKGSGSSTKGMKPEVVITTKPRPCMMRPSKSGPRAQKPE